jgi:invasion protein IalB
MFLLFVAALAANPEAAPAPASTAVEKPQAEKKTCRKVESTSSRMAKRVCKTETDWAAHDRSANAADLKRMGAR